MLLLRPGRPQLRGGQGTLRRTRGTRTYPSTPRDAVHDAAPVLETGHAALCGCSKRDAAFENVASATLGWHFGGASSRRRGDLGWNERCDLKPHAVATHLPPCRRRA